ncbi:Podosporapepsin [Beauveria bassiana D1-5]|uniref:Podosporapepsin n=1 Tax=Beauveria bassiana D1-5 TaxID=1245745 RepID=A0A0A2W0M4_BEABA|nr:Podosporapepsin [Beauveria bassiana D1-5]
MRSTALIGIVTTISSVFAVNPISPGCDEEFADDVGMGIDKRSDLINAVPNFFKQNGTFALRFHKSPFGHRFTVPVQIGDPPEFLELDVHIGMATTWVLGPDPVTRGGWPVADRKVWVPGNSSEHVKRKKGFKNFDLWYPEKHAVQGTVYRDRMSIGEGSQAFGYWHQDFGVAKEIHPRFVSENSFVGVLGLGYKSDRGAHLPESIVTNMQENLGHSWRFSIAFKESGGMYKFSSKMIQELTSVGHMDWNMHDDSRHTGDLFRTVYYNNDKIPDGNQNSYHVLNMTGYAFGSGKIRKKIFQAGMDSTTSYILAPQPIAEDYYRTIGAPTREIKLPTGHRGWEVPCKKKLPDFVIEFTNTTTRIGNELLDGEKKYWGFRKYNISGESLVLQKTRADPKRKKEWCLGAIVQNEDKFYPDRAGLAVSEEQMDSVWQVPRHHNRRSFLRNGHGSRY